jgi:hypothetical protein
VVYMSMTSAAPITINWIDRPNHNTEFAAVVACGNHLTPADVTCPVDGARIIHRRPLTAAHIEQLAAVVLIEAVIDIEASARMETVDPVEVDVIDEWILEAIEVHASGFLEQGVTLEGTRVVERTAERVTVEVEFGVWLAAPRGDESGEFVNWVARTTNAVTFDLEEVA